MGRDPDAVARAFDVAERAGLVLMEAFMYRHHPQIKRARELLDEGAVGELRLVRAAFCSTLRRPDDVRWVRSSAAARCSTSVATASAGCGSSRASRNPCSACRR